VAGNARQAHQLAVAIESKREAERQINSSLEVFGSATAGTEDQPQAEFIDLLKKLAPRLIEQRTALQQHVQAVADLARAEDVQTRVNLEFDLGLGQTVASKEQARQDVKAARQAEQAGRAQLAQALASIREELEQRLGAAQAEALVGGAEALVARDHWDAVLQAEFTPAQLEGEAAKVLAEALAARWTIEMDAAAKLAQARSERAAYRAAPEIYKTRRLADVLVEGLRDARKFFVAFDPGQRVLRVRFLIDDDIRIEPYETRPEDKQR
jgi:hypothetical protein